MIDSRFVFMNTVQIRDEEDDELDDREAFEYDLLVASTLRVCACCGQERGGHLILDKVYDVSDTLFAPLHGDLVLVPGEPVRCCTRCALLLKKGKRPKYAIRIPPPDKRFTDLSPLEFRLIRPIVPVITLYQMHAEGQFSSVGGTVNFMNDSLKVVSRLPRPVHACGGVWIRHPKSTTSQMTTETKVNPGQLRKVLADVIGSAHLAFPGAVIAEDNLAALGTVDASDIELPALNEDSDDDEAGHAHEDAKEHADRQSIYGADAQHTHLMEAPEGVTAESFLRSLFSDAPENVPGEAEALPGEPGMLEGIQLQPHFAPDCLVNEAVMGRTIFMRVFVQHFTDGHGGWDEADEELTESEFIECCAFWHTRQFQTDFEFVAFACKQELHDKIMPLPN